MRLFLDLKIHYFKSSDKQIRSEVNRDKNWNIKTQIMKTKKKTIEYKSNGILEVEKGTLWKMSLKFKINTLDHLLN